MRVDRRAVGRGRPGRELYRGQCNCGYWHGAFGGIYLPHLRNAVYQHLIAADNLLDRAVGPPEGLGRRHGRRLQFRRAAGSPAGQRQAGGADRSAPRRPVSTSSTSARSATTCWPRSPGGPEAYHRKVLGRRRRRQRRRGQHPRPRRLQAEGPRPAGPVRRPPAQEPGRPVLRRRRHARRRRLAARRRNAATSSTGRTKPGCGATPTGSRSSSRGKATPSACRCEITKGLTLDGRQFDAGDRLPAGRSAARPVAAFRRRD